MTNSTQSPSSQNLPPRKTVASRSKQPQSTTTVSPSNSIKDMVKDAFVKKASDIHIRVGHTTRYRIQGEMVRIKDQVKVTPEIFEQYLSEILTPHQRQQFAEMKELDTAIFYPGIVRCRVNCFDSLTGGAMVLRLINLKIPSIDELRLPEVLKNIISYPQGLILVTGPTGSGKSTTLAAMLRYLNETARKHIVTIEDPIEFVHASRQCLISQREVGLHTLEFHHALRAVLREDPDVILIGEMRDRTTVNTALQASQTGHLVLGTLHTRNAINSVNRLLNLYNVDEQPAVRIQICDSLVAIIAQLLIPTVDNKRTAVHDILVNTPAMKDYLLKGDEESATHLMENDTYEGMQLINQAIFEQVTLGRITMEEAEKSSPDSADLDRRFRMAGLDSSGVAREFRQGKSLF
ncbi:MULTISPECIES: type IV pilus twitching motility protein PilT [Arthrospira]|uniref:Twitching motility protein n=1 Tax=Limnospira platensis NIES-46 TaxID=1236695 RepID=A0A5M3T3E6_LIMPL|nr:MULTISPECIES: PilT/PilU family type 4a pilus ATPase [Arthrospira]AMW29007.1 type IV pili twitching motility protein PilT [Arthrospira platensis YZ]MBD2667873.1 PilT/PilU family type 4a pilus ATPase [Arthrospira platensis FACHB-439]MBD2708685.1 PilT/PilU family type 4a pilus ATPase [Arthrospira platensis FACHB-835]MDF2212824.1 PilT/PilU family type 4a pilus ATPase [Arthrospira platensis NCB002]MDT9182889.1 PilT/PilU family type 4a pilus ATPase [Limnospira sp. PMC 289.06]MDT9295039.1 PilT/Pi